MIIEDKSLRDRVGVFASRHQAGSLLSHHVAAEDFDLLLIIPNGGLPVGLGLFKSPLVRKTPVDFVVPVKRTVVMTAKKIVLPDGREIL